MALNKEKQILYMISVLSNLLLIYLDMLFEKQKDKPSQLKQFILKYKQQLEITKVISEAIIEETFKNDEIKNTNTFQNITNKIETIIRKESGI